MLPEISMSLTNLFPEFLRYMYRYQYIPGTLWAMMVKPSQAPVYKQSEDKIQCSLSLARDGLTS